MSAAATSARPGLRLMPPLLALGVGLLVLLLVFLPESQAAVRVWIQSTAYGHCFLVVPIAAYLAWERRDRVRGMEPRPTMAFVALGLPLAGAWFAAERLGIMEGRQLAALGFVELLFMTVLGWRLFRAMMAPLLYLVFLVPFGAFVTPALQTFTAHFIDVGLTALNISHFSNDMYIEISAGTFFVAEACAGLRFLIAAVAFGVFYALLNYDGIGRRLLFIGASIIVPIVANGFRALGIVLLGHILGSAEAAAADHILYGWVFFSIVMLLLVVGGLPLREAHPVPRVPRPALPGASAPARPWAAVAVLLLAAMAPGVSRALDRSATAPSLVRAPVFVAPEGCRLADQAMVCGERRWTIVVEALPSRSTAASVQGARLRLVGPLDGETTTVRGLSDLPGGAGSWTAVVSEEPPLIAGFSVWMHGEPARGGLSQRLTQARDSVLGNDVPPVVIVISTQPRHGMGPRDAEAVLAELTRIVAAQTGLAAEVKAVTAPRP